MKVKAAIEILKANGWTFLRKGKGDHVHYGHPDSPNIATIDGRPSKEIPPGTLASLRRATGIEELR